MIRKTIAPLTVTFLSLILISTAHLQAQAGPTPAPNRSPKDGGGPYDRLVIRGVTVIEIDVDALAPGAKLNVQLAVPSGFTTSSPDVTVPSLS